MASLQRGFTMVELVVVLILVGILSVVAVPRLGDTRSFDTRGFRDDFTAAVRYAQKTAVASGCRVRVRVASVGYSVERESCLPAITTACTDNGGSWNPLTAPARDGSLAGTPPPAVSLSGSPASFSFCANGKASGAASYTVSGGGFTGTVAINAETGYVDANP